MQNILWLLRWILKAAIFFTLFAFALNNQHEVTAHFFFGSQWKASLVVLLLITFTAGLFIGVLGMLPRWWRQRKLHNAAAAQAVNASLAAGIATAPAKTQDGVV